MTPLRYFAGDIASLRRLAATLNGGFCQLKNTNVVQDETTAPEGADATVPGIARAFLRRLGTAVRRPFTVFALPFTAVLLPCTAGTGCGRLAFRQVRGNRPVVLLCCCCLLVTDRAAFADTPATGSRQFKTSSLVSSSDYPYADSRRRWEIGEQPKIAVSALPGVLRARVDEGFKVSIWKLDISDEDEDGAISWQFSLQMHRDLEALHVSACYNLRSAGQLRPGHITPPNPFRAQHRHGF